jgi:hypothetical protein
MSAEHDKDIKHWISNNKDLANRCALLSQRPDLPVDRIPAYKELIRLQLANAVLTSELNLLRDSNNDQYPD